jgi:hypothetical protein
MLRKVVESVMDQAKANPCANCERLQAQLDAQRLQIEALQQALAHLQEQLAAARKDSSNSSKPPSSDIVKPPKPASTDASFSTVRNFLRDVAAVSISRGQLAKVIAKVGAALAAPYDELLMRLPDEGHVNVDETGHKDNGTLMWTWCFRAERLHSLQDRPAPLC